MNMIVAKSELIDYMNCLERPESMKDLNLTSSTSKSLSGSKPASTRARGRSRTFGMTAEKATECYIEDDHVICNNGGNSVSASLDHYAGSICPPTPKWKLKQLRHLHESNLTALGSRHVFTLWASSTVGAYECWLSVEGPVCSVSGGDMEWSWEHFDSLVFSAHSRSPQTNSYGHFRFITFVGGGMKITCTFFTNCFGENLAGVDITAVGPNTFTADPSAVGAAFTVRFAAPMRPEVLIDSIPDGLRFLVPSDELRSLIGDGGRTYASGSLMCASNGGFTSCGSFGFGVGKIRLEFKNSNDLRRLNSLSKQNQTGG
jgi:hypothetical protein